MAKGTDKATYVTTFCNFPHRIATGRPIGHECYILPSAMLRADLAGDMDRALNILRERGKGPIVVGRKG